MRKSYLVSRIRLLALVIAGVVSPALAQADALDNPATIRIAPLSKSDNFTPKAGAQVIDPDGIRRTAGEVVVSPFTLKAIVGGDTVEISVPEFQVASDEWVADPIGCVDDDPKTRCHPVWGIEYSGQVGEDLPVYVENGTEGGVFHTGTLSLSVNVTVIDNKVRGIEGYLQIAFNAETGLPNYRVPVAGKLK